MITVNRSPFQLGPSSPPQGACTIRRLAAGAALLAALLSAACTTPPGLGTDRTEVAVYDPKRDPLVNPPTLTEPYPWQEPELVADNETLIRYSLSDPRTLNPIMSIFWEDFYANVALFERLVQRNAKMEPELNQVLIERAEVAPDQSEVEIWLKPGHTWHDGEPWTARDVLFTWEAILDDRVPAPAYKHRAGKIAGIDVFDDYHLRVRFVEPAVVNLFALLFPPIPEHIFGKSQERAKDPSLRSSEYYNHYSREEVIGSGPYRLVEWIPNDRVIFERWEGFPSRERRPAFRRLVLKVQSDRNLALLEFKKGQLDEYMLTPQQFATQTNDAEFARVGVKGHAPVRRIGYLIWNQDGSNPFFGDRRVRQAMAYAYDIRRVVREVTYGLYLVTNGIFDPDHFGHDSEVPVYEHDLERAAQLLDEAGWRESTDDGWRYREIDGQPVRFAFELAMGETFEDAVRMAAIYQQDLRRIGVDLTVRVYENATLEQKLQEHEFQAVASAQEVTTDPDDWAIHLASESCEVGRNYGCYKSDVVDELLARGRREHDRERRAEIYREMHRQLAQDQPFLMMWNYAELRAYHKRLRGIEFAPSGVFLFTPTPPAGSDWSTSPGWWVHRDDALRVGRANGGRESGG